jgi:LmbE family N-acetylglucosaminyl deacetylase
MTTTSAVDRGQTVRMSGSGDRRVLALVVAHPDDDAYGLAGTVALHAEDPAFRFILIHATDGAKGDIAPGFPATPQTLGALRRAEDAKAWRALGRIPDRHEWLDYEDGEVAAVPFDEVVRCIADVLTDERPDVVATFGPDGITGHPDHIAIGAATDAAFHLCRQEPGPGFRRLVHGALPLSVFERWNESRKRQGLPMWDPAETYHLRGVPDAEIGITVDVSSVASAVVAGLREHRSQQHVLVDRRIEDEDWARSASREHLVIAWPPGLPNTPGGARLGDVFEGLDAQG